MSTNSMNPKGTARPVTKPAKKVVGAKVRKIVRNSAKSIVVLNVTKADVLGLNLENVAIYFALEGALGPNNPIVWPAEIFMTTAFVNKSVLQCKDTTLSNTNGRKIQTENTLMGPLVSKIAPNIY